MPDADSVRDGFAGPFAVFNEAECASILAELNAAPGRPKTWVKGWAAANPGWFRVASDPRIVDLVRPLLGPDIVLWGASLVVRDGSAIHAFHTDVESADPDGGFASVWIGLENTDRGSGLKFVPGSHRYGITIQEMNDRAGISRGASNDDSVLAAAHQFDAAAEIVQPPVENGAALVFDGRSWHGSHNQNQSTRTALLLQFARADRPVYIPRTYNWPIVMRTDRRPPVLLVAGNAPADVNAIVAPPGGRAGSVPNAAHRVPRGLPRPEEPFSSASHFEGSTPCLDAIESHSSGLAPGASPHALHAHVEEEILVVVSGEAEILTADDGNGANLQRHRLGPGGFTYYPAWQHHTLSNPGAAPLIYTMLKWRNDDGRAGPALPLRISQPAPSLFATSSAGRQHTTTMEGATRWLDRLQAHVSVAAPGTGYPAHADRYDVAILLLSGSIDTLGETVTAPALLFHPAGSLHGLRVAGSEPARYLVFELERRDRNPLRALAGAVERHLGRAANRLRQLLRRRRN